MLFSSLDLCRIAKQILLAEIRANLSSSDQDDSLDDGGSGDDEEEQEESAAEEQNAYDGEELLYPISSATFSVHAETS